MWGTIPGVLGSIPLPGTVLSVVIQEELSCSPSCYPINRPDQVNIAVLNIDQSYQSIRQFVEHERWHYILTCSPAGMRFVWWPAWYFCSSIMQHVNTQISKALITISHQCQHKIVEINLIYELFMICGFYKVCINYSLLIF